MINFSNIRGVTRQLNCAKNYAAELQPVKISYFNTVLFPLAAIMRIRVNFLATLLRLELLSSQPSSIHFSDLSLVLSVFC